MRVALEYRRAFAPLFEAPKRWSVVVAHRRAGKTTASLQRLIHGALTCSLSRPRFAFIAPLYKQAKTVAWDTLKAFLAPLPGVTFNEAELRADFESGARIQLFGADNPDALRGQYLDGVVMDEYAQMDPRLWAEVVRPALADRRGWAIWIGTPAGPNAFKEIYDSATGPTWTRLMLRADETGLVAPDELEAARAEMTPEAFEQEFLCSFQAAVRGAYFGREMSAAEQSGRITDVPHDSSHPVETWWDLGMRDQTVIWFAQRIGAQVRLVDLYANSGSPLDHYVSELRARHYSYSRHVAPHDIEVRELGTGKSRLEIARNLGIDFEIAPHLSLEDGINAVRMMLPSTWIDRTRCAIGIEALQLYRAKYDETARVFQARPLHDWTSHYADALRMGAVARQSIDLMPMHRHINRAAHGGWMGA